MSDGDDKRDPGTKGISPEDRASILARAGDIDRRLAEARARHAPESSADARARGRAMGQGLRIAVELVVGVAFGAFVGYWLDRSLGTAPGLMMVMLILGFAAGMTNVIRTARRMQADAEAAQRAASSVPNDNRSV